MNNDVLNKKESKILHGVAILMMVYHHIFIDGNTMYINKPSSILSIFNIINVGNAPTFQLTFAWFCRICVAVFAFTSGYGICSQLFIKCKNNDIKEMYKYVLKRLLSFYKVFLFCFIVFIGLEFLTGNMNDFDTSIGTFIINLLGLRADYNGTWWYVIVYYEMVLLSPLVFMLLNNPNLKKIIVIIITLLIVSLGIAFFTGNIIPFYKAISKFIQTPATINIIIFIEGMACYKYKILDWIASKLNILTSLALLIIVFNARAIIIRAPSDSLFDIIFIIPFIVSITKLINCSKILTKVLEFVGKYSSYIWYSHPYFYAYLLFPIVISCDASIVVYLQIVIYSLLLSIILSFVQKKIEMLLKNKKA